MDDRRISNRIPINVKVKYASYDTEHQGFSTDISSLGIFIESKDPPDKGAQLQLQFRLPLLKEKAEIRATGIVERIVDRNEAGITFSIPGFGVRFVTFEDDCERKMKTFVGLKLLEEKRQILSPAPAPVQTVSAPKQSPPEQAPPEIITEKLAETPPAVEKPLSDKEKAKLEKRARIEKAEKAFGDGLRTYRTGDYEKAIFLMKEATRLNPNKSSYFNALKEMEETYRKNNVFNTLKDVEEDINNSRYEIATQKLKNCMKIVHDDPRIIRLMAKTLILKGKNPVEALNWANKAYSMRVSDPENQYILGLAYKKLGNKERARSLFMKAAQKSNHVEALAELDKL
ncbi:PilZ domain-containing protein [candidate division CSSED10-310 bacterium]|uniref:PilZ domain-containing protein n=1 Tax=candidate division CSSED10-310 bacterium TaxID=2855610 RepID=A0ABV6YRE5_UNCC1